MYYTFTCIETKTNIPVGDITYFPEDEELEIYQLKKTINLENNKIKKLDDKTIEEFNKFISKDPIKLYNEIIKCCDCVELKYNTFFVYYDELRSKR